MVSFFKNPKKKGVCLVLYFSSAVPKPRHPNILVGEVVICDNILNKLSVYCCFAALFTIVNSQYDSAQHFGNAKINVDETFEPATAPIQRTEGSHH